MGPPIKQDDVPVTATPDLYGQGGGVFRSRCRSFCFLERESIRWTAFLITYERADGHWRGYFTFRSVIDEETLREVRTADLFVERSEEDVDTRAKGLGRPLLIALLESALDADERKRGFSPDVQKWFREILRRHAAERSRSDAAAWGGAVADQTLELGRLRRLYESYRLDQVAHLIALLEPDDFREMVEIRLSGRRIDFNSRDRLQLAMTVVQDLERRLPLPPFEVWVEDYLAHSDEYLNYSRKLHGAKELP